MTILLAMLFIQPVVAVSFVNRDLGANGGASSGAVAINESGTIIGFNWSDGKYLPFIWSEENGMSQFIIPAYDVDRIDDINDQGQIIGLYNYDCNVFGICSTRPFIWSPEDGTTNITINNVGHATWATGVNNNGQVVGITSLWGPIAGFIWTATSGAINIGTLGGPYTEAYDINDLGEVVGRGNAYAGDIYFYQAFIWKDGVMTNLGSLGGNTPSRAYAINNRGDIVGVSVTSLGFDNITVWMNDTTPRRMIDLGIPGRTVNEAKEYDINDNDQVVGSIPISNCGTNYCGTMGFYWTESEGLSFMPDEYHYTDVAGINNRGQMVGRTTHGSHINATMWTIAGDDTTPPTITINAPNGNYILNQIVAADYSCEDPSGVTVCSGTFPNGSNIDTSTVGMKTFSVLATDTIGNSITESITYNVTYNFTGFFSPVDNIPTFNKMKAGGAVPVKFSLNGDQGLDIFAPGYPKSTAIACNDANASEIGVNETVTAGQSGLFYDSTLDQYEYIWKTDKSWTGTCRQLVMKFDDGTYQRANFDFK